MQTGVADKRQLELGEPRAHSKASDVGGLLQAIYSQFHAPVGFVIAPSWSAVGGKGL